MQNETIPVLVRRSNNNLANGGTLAPRVPVAVRVGTLDDLPFIDKLQKAHSKELGFLPTMALQGKVKLGQLLIAEVRSEERGARMPESESSSGSDSLLASHSSLLPTPVGYLIAADRYFKRDEVGYVTQINVAAEYRRSLVAGALLQAQFDRSAWGCRLYCCWCAQDLKANEFWEAMGFVPIAFRTGSRTKGKGGTPRMHVFWQKRIRSGDVSTPWWYPSQTGGGELREDRLVFPIPPGVGWRDVLPVVLPKNEDPAAVEAAEEKAKLRRKKVVKTRIVMRPRGPRMPGGLWFADDLIEWEEEYEEWVYLNKAGEEVAKPKKPKDVAVPLDPRLTAMARDLRDRWADRPELILEAAAKHDVRRVAADAEPPTLSMEAAPKLTLPAAA